MVSKHKSKDTKKLAIEYYKNNNVSYVKVASIFQKKINKKKRQKEIQDIKKVVLTKYSFV